MPEPSMSSTASAARVTSGLVDAACIGLPDAVTSLWCLWVWIHPMAFGAETVKCVVLMMLMEFILLNVTGLFTVIPFMLMFGRGVRMAMLMILSAIYALLIAAFATQFQALWPYLAFGWMVVGKVVWVVRNRRVSQAEQMWLMGGWAVSVIAYLCAVGVGAATNMPQMGITPASVPTIYLPGGGALLEAPHRLVASAVFYFASVALFKWMYVVVRRHRQGRQQSGEGEAEMDDSFGSA